jgi:hypothetical protein
MIDNQVEDQNRAALENQQYFADWSSVSTAQIHRGTVISPMQNLDRLQAIPRKWKGSDE